MEIPFELRYLKAKQDIVNSINSAIKVYKIPFVIIDTVLADISRQVQQSAEMERDLAQKQYEEYLKSSKAAEEGNNGTSQDNAEKQDDNLNEWD